MASKPFKELGSDVQGKPENLFPLIAHGIVIGPRRTHALGLGTFRSPREYSIDWLARKAAFLAQVYAEEGEGARPEHSALRELLRDDTFRRNRRRRLPEPYAEGQSLFLFDVDLFVFDEESHSSCDRDSPFGSVLLSLVANYGDVTKVGEEGMVQAIPWTIVNDAVQIAGYTSSTRPAGLAR